MDSPSKNDAHAAKVMRDGLQRQKSLESRPERHSGEW